MSHTDTPKTPKLIPAREHTGPVLVAEGFPGSNNGYFEDMRELVTACIQYGVDLPADIEACEKRGPGTPKAGDLIRQELESQEFYDGAAESLTAAKEAQLQALLDLWWENCGIEGWFPTKDQIEPSPELLLFIRDERRRISADPSGQWKPVEGLDAFLAPAQADRR